MVRGPSWDRSLRFRGVRDSLSVAGRYVPVERVRDWRPSAVRTWLLRLANSYLARHPTEFGPTRTRWGFSMAGNTQDVLQRHVYVFGVWEPALSSWVAELLQPGDVCLDFGANTGYFSLLAATKVGDSGHVVSFEPVPTILAQLRRNIAASGLGHIVEVRPVVASDAAGSVEVFCGPAANIGMSGTEQLGDSFVSEGRVEAVVASDAVDVSLWPRVRLIKIDVEGDEMRVLRGLEPVLAALAPESAVMTEVAPDRLASRGDDASALMALLSRNGFSAHRVENDYSAGYYANPGPMTPEPQVGVPASQTDVLFVKEQPQIPS